MRGSVNVLTDMSNVAHGSDWRGCRLSALRKNVSGVKLLLTIEVVPEFDVWLKFFVFLGG